MHRLLRFAIPAVLGIIAVAPSARADGFDVSLNTSSLSGTQVLVFELNQGDGVATNTVTLSGFGFGGGSALGSPDLLGTTGATGDLSTGVTLSDASSFTVLFSQQFNPGTLLSFVLNTTNNFAGGTTPDAFSMSICDIGFDTCYSDDTTSGALLVLNLTGGDLSSSFTLNGASAQNLGAPVVSQVPEPTTLLLVAMGMAAAMFKRRKLLRM